MLRRAALLSNVGNVIAFTGSDLQNYHIQCIHEKYKGVVLNLNLTSADEPVVMHERCEVYSLVKLYRQRIFEIAKEKVLLTPVIIILEDGNEAVQAQLTKQGQTVYNLAKMDQSAVESSMRVFTNQNQGLYSVFIINDNQGRGLDFQSTTQIEKNGGIYLIIAQLPNCFLQYKQYLGRIGRIGNKGTFSTIFFDKDSKNMEGSNYLQQRLEKLKNDDMLQFLRSMKINALPAVGAEGIGKEIQEEQAQTESENLSNIIEALSCKEEMTIEAHNQFVHPIIFNEENSVCSMENRSSPPLLEENKRENQKGLQDQRNEKFMSKQSVRHSKRLAQAEKLMDEIDQGYFDSYSKPHIHQEMLADKVRNEAYERAIQNQCNGKVVADIGAGSGVLSILAAQAGASHVYGIEYSNFIEVARENVRRNPQFQSITLIQDLAEEVMLPVQQVDTIVSEWMGYFLLCEDMFNSVFKFRNKYLKEQGTMIPRAGQIYIAAILKPDEVLGLDLSLVDKVNLCEATQGICDPDWIMTIPIKVFDENFKTCKDWQNSFEADFQVILEKDCEINGFVGWFDTEMTDNVYLTTSPLSPATHWMQSIFMLPQKFKYNANDQIHGTIKVAPRKENHRAMQIKLHLKASTLNKTFTQVYNLN